MYAHKQRNPNFNNNNSAINTSMASSNSGENTNKGIYPAMDAFVGDIVNDVKYFDSQHIELNGNDPEGLVPIAIWGDRVYFTNAEKHMAIRPPNETGFPDFVGTYQRSVIGQLPVYDNDTGHYKTDAGAWSSLPPSVTRHGTYEPRSAGNVLRMTMFSDPNEYINKVRYFQANPKSASAFLKQHPEIYQEIENKANQGVPVFRKFLKISEGRTFNVSPSDELDKINSSYKLLTTKNQQAIHQARVELLRTSSEIDLPAYLASDDALARFVGCSENWSKGNQLSQNKIVQRAKTNALQLAQPQNVAAPSVIAAASAMPDTTEKAALKRQPSVKKRLMNLFNKKN